MNQLRCGLRFAASRTLLCCLAFYGLAVVEPASAINITVDYRYDNGPNPFFTEQVRKDALQAAANRLSAVITESLTAAVLPNDATTDPRIGFNHPGTGAYFEVSPATSAANDALVTMASPPAPAANEYRGPWSIAANEWILYAGGRDLAVLGEGGTGTGTNFNSVYSSGTSHLNRGFRPSGSVNNLPVWGGAVSFDSVGTTWHFNPDTTPAAGSIDFYSIALHEIGHALGLSATSTEWDILRSGSQFMGPQTLDAYNADNSSSVSFLNQESSGNRHWDDGAYNSRIFQNANPKLVATVGTGALQDLLMEPTANFTVSVKRFELTNVDVAALRDIGWSTVPQITAQPGDYNNDGVVNAADYVVFRKGITGDYATFRANFGEGTPGGSPVNSSYFGVVPEPASWLILLTAIYPVFYSWRPTRR